MNYSINSNKLTLLIVNIIFGCALIYSYYYFIKNGGVNIKTLWGKVYDKKIVFEISMILALISYLIIIGFAIFKTPNTKKNNAIISNLTIIQLLIIVVSMLWLPLTIIYAKNAKKNKHNSLGMFAVILVLLIVALGSFKQIFLINMLSEEKTLCAQVTKKIAIIAAGYFFVHTFFFDSIGWNMSFFSNFKQPKEL